MVISLLPHHTSPEPLLHGAVVLRSWGHVCHAHYHMLVSSPAAVMDLGPYMHSLIPSLSPVHITSCSQHVVCAHDSLGTRPVNTAVHVVG